jgi:hypothetical protein
MLGHLVSNALQGSARRPRPEGLLHRFWAFFFRH